MTLDLHPASDEERLAAFANVHDVWSRGLPLPEHLERRAANPIHQRAHWYVATLDGQVVSSLGAQPLEFVLEGRLVRGIGIGSVHTLAPFRGRGFAPRLLDWVEDRYRGQGCALSLLYSDIPPAYYARLGYRLAPAHLGTCDVAPVGTSTQRARLEALPPSAAAEHRGWWLETFAPAARIEALAELYAGDLERLPLAIRRDGEYWRHLLARRPDDALHWVVDPDGRRAGYVRLGIKDGALAILDLAAAGDFTRLEPALYALVCDRAARMGCPRVGTWIADTPAARQAFAIADRSQEISMLKPLDESLVLDDRALAAVDRFAEIDHV